MDFKVLASDPLWQRFWDSEEVRTITSGLTSQLVNATLDSETRGRIRGQLQMLTKLPAFVKAQADKQEKEENRIAESVEETARRSGVFPFRTIR